MPNLSVQIDGLEQLIKKFQGAEDILTSNFRKAILKAQITVQAQARIEAPVDRGPLRQGITFANSIADRGLSGAVIATQPYSFWVHEGRAAGGMPPWDLLEEWAVRHGMPGAGFAIALKISREGTKPNPFFTRALDVTQGTVSGFWETAAADSIAELARR